MPPGLAVPSSTGVIAGLKRVQEDSPPVNVQYREIDDSVGDLPGFSPVVDTTTSI